jgi:hypothetical protein
MGNTFHQTLSALSGSAPLPPSRLRITINFEQLCSLTNPVAAGKKR